MNWYNSLDKLLYQLAQGLSLTDCEQAYLAEYLPTDLLSINEREVFQLIPKIYPRLQDFASRFAVNLSWQNLWRFYAPLVVFLLAQKPPFCLGIVGMQGTGKTTLSLLLKHILEICDRRVLCLSLDDLYKTYSDRQQLQKSDPRFRWRGVPHTHDVALGLELFTAIRHNHYPLSVPRFDKSLHQGAGDRTSPEVINDPLDIVLFEGWFVGAQCLNNLPASASQFTQDCNQKLRDYQPLWQVLDYLVALIPSDYRYSLQWRQSAEIKQIEQGKGGMSPAEVQEFVDYFWQALPPEIYLPDIANRSNLVVHLDSDRQVLHITTGFSDN